MNDPGSPERRSAGPVRTVPNRLDPAALALINASLMGDTFTMDRILSGIYQDPADWPLFALILSNMAAGLLATSCGSVTEAADKYYSCCFTLSARVLLVPRLPGMRLM